MNTGDIIDDDLESEATGYELTPAAELWHELEWSQDSTSEPGRAMLRELKRRFDAAIAAAERIGRA